MNWLSKEDKKALAVGKVVQRYLQAGWPPWDGITEYQLETERASIRHLNSKLYGDNNAQRNGTTEETVLETV